MWVDFKRMTLILGGGITLVHYRFHFFVKRYQVILNQTLNNGKIEKSPRKNGKEEPKTQETRGKRMKNVPKTPRSERHLCFSHYSN